MTRIYDYAHEGLKLSATLIELERSFISDELQTILYTTILYINTFDALLSKLNVYTSFAVKQ